MPFSHLLSKHHCIFFTRVNYRHNFHHLSSGGTQLCTIRTKLLPTFFRVHFSRVQYYNKRCGSFGKLDGDCSGREYVEGQLERIPTSKRSGIFEKNRSCIETGKRFLPWSGSRFCVVIGCVVRLEHGSEAFALDIDQRKYHNPQAQGIRPISTWLSEVHLK